MRKPTSDPDDKRRNTPERFMGHVRKVESGCWEWTGGVDRGGYGKTRYLYRYVRTHRLAYQWFVGPIPEGMWVLHRCDNRLCVKPAHLFLGDHIDNLRDAREKGRLRTSTKRVLDAKKVRLIRRWKREGKPLLWMSQRLGINNWTIKNVIDGETWYNIK